MADGASPAPKRKRTKKKTESPNEGILKFLREMDADTTGNMSYAIRRAIKSIATEQLVIRTHEDLLRIKYVGGFLATEIAAYLAENPPATSPSASNLSQPNGNSLSSAAPTVPPPNTTPPNITSLDALAPNMSTLNRTIPNQTLPNNSSRHMRKREYSPRYRSGPFAILLALQDAEAKGVIYLGKADLGEHAQKYAEEPIHDHGGASRSTKYAYDGWSSMGRTLIPKNLVIKAGNPARYSLTDTGRVLAGHCAEMLATAESNVVCTYDPSVPCMAPMSEPAAITDGAGNASVSTSALSSIPAPAAAQQSRRPRTQRSRARKARPVSAPEATVQSNSEYSTILLTTEVVSGLQADGHPRQACLDALNIVLKSGDIPNTVPMLRIAILANLALTISNGLSDRTTERSPSAATRIHASRSISAPSTAAPSIEPPNDDFVFVLSGNSEEPKDSIGNTSLALPINACASEPATSARQITPTPPVSNASTALTSMPAAGSVSRSGYPSRIANADDTVVLLIDVREKLGRGAAQNSERFAGVIRAAGVPAEVRKLPVGDALYVRRCSQTGTDTVLDFIAERKTVSDFAGSVKDGRIERQAFSMLNSSFTRRVFVIEGTFSKEHISETFLERLHKTMAELSIFYGFLVKRTRNTPETVAFYKSMYRRLTTAAMQERVVEEERFESWSNRMEEFNTGLSVAQLFFLQLCRIPGVGKQRAEAIINMGFTTAALLCEAYKSVNEENRPLFLREEAKRRGAQPVGPLVSERVHQFFNAERYGTNIANE